MTTREATVINQRNGEPFLDMDPIDVEIRVDGSADPKDEALIRTLGAVLDAEAEFDGLVLLLVWTDTLLTAPVEVTCGICGNPVRADDEATIQDEMLVCPTCVD